MEPPNPEEKTVSLAPIHTTKLQEKARCLDTFPAELIEMIAIFLSTEDLRSLRQVNKTISNATVNHLVKKFVTCPIVDFSFDGLQRLIDISRGYDVSREIHYNNKLTSCTFVHSVWSDREATACREAATVPSITVEQAKMIEKRAQKAASLWSSHEGMLSRGLYQELLSKFLQNFPRAELHGFSDLESATHQEGELGEAHLGGEASDEVYYLPTEKEMSERYAFTLETVLAALQTSGVRMAVGFKLASRQDDIVGGRLGLKALNEVVARLESNPNDDSRWTFLERIWSLKMAFTDNFGEEAVASLEEQKSIVRLLQPVAQFLTWLTLHGVEAMFDEALLPIMRHLSNEVYLPKLEYLHLEVAAMRYSDLAKFLHRHQKGLRVLLLNFVTMENDGWKDLFGLLLELELPEAKHFEVISPAEAEIDLVEDEFELDNGLDLGWPTATNTEKKPGWWCHKTLQRILGFNEMKHEILAWIISNIQPMPIIQ